MLTAKFYFAPADDLSIYIGLEVHIINKKNYFNLKYKG